MVNPNDPNLVLQFKGDLEATVWKWANAMMAPSWDLDPVEDFDAALNISIDDKYKEEVEQTVDTGERPPRQGRLDGIQHAEFFLTSVPHLVRDPVNDYPAPKAILRAHRVPEARLVFGESQARGRGARDVQGVHQIAQFTQRRDQSQGSRHGHRRERHSAHASDGRTDLEGPIHLYYPGSPDPKKPLHEEMTLTDAGLQAQVGLPIIYLIAPKITFISEQEALAPLAGRQCSRLRRVQEALRPVRENRNAHARRVHGSATAAHRQTGHGREEGCVLSQKDIGRSRRSSVRQHDHHSDRSQAERTVAVPRRTSARTRRHGIRDVHVQSAVVPTTEIGQLRRLLTHSSAERTDDAARRHRFTSPDSKSHTSRFPVREATC